MHENKEWAQYVLNYIMLIAMSITMKPLIFVTGKGGVGKSLVAASIASKLSGLGRKVLLVEFGEHSFFAKYLNISDVGYLPKPSDLKFDVVLWNTKDCLRDYVTYYLKIPKFYDLFFENRVMSEIIDASPALKELALLGKITSGLRRVGPALDYDHIVIDSYSTGHHKALLMAAKGMSQIFTQGPMGYHSKKMLDILNDPNKIQNIIVMKPEDLPVIEGLELDQFIRAEFKSKTHVVLNQWIHFPDHELKFNHSTVEFYNQLRRDQIENLNRLRAAQINPIFIPFLFDTIEGRKLTEQIAGENLVELV